MKFPLYCILVLMLSGCLSGEAPTQQWVMAQKGAYSAHLSKDGSHLLIGSIHHGGSYWQIDPLERLYNWNHESGKLTGIIASAISDNGLFASTSDHRKIVLWNTKTGEAFWLWESPADIRSMDLSNDGQFALLGLESYEAVLFDIKNGGIKSRMPHEGIVQTVDMTADRKVGISGGDDSLVQVWDLQSGSLLQRWQLKNQIKVVAISDDGVLGFAASHRGEAKIWNVQLGKEVANLEASSGYLISARFNSNGSQLLTGSSSGQVTLWDVKSATILTRWKLSPKDQWVSKNTMVLDVAFSGKGFKAVGANGVTYELQRKGSL